MAGDGDTRGGGEAGTGFKARDRSGAQCGIRNRRATGEPVISSTIQFRSTDHAALRQKARLIQIDQ